MASTHGSFAAYLSAAMDSAGVRAVDLPDATNGVVKSSTIYRWLRGEANEAKGELSVKLLRAVAHVLNVPLLEMLVAADVITAIEAGFEKDPTPPPPRPTFEDIIRADPGYSPGMKDAMIKLLEAAREEDRREQAGRRRS